ncbi:MAG: NADP-specific glutamate dehydrogenase [Verrucomicrobiota bacterium]
MTDTMVKTKVNSFMEDICHRNPGEKEFHQAVQEVVESLMPFVLENPKYLEANLLERLTEPDRIIIFRVCWQDDKGNINVNRAWRVQFNNTIGPYKGGLRFHPTVNQSILKFLGFEQTFKNSLTGLPMGGAKGGSNFNPKGKSDSEVMRFCQALMTELHRHIGEHTDVPAGDMGVGAREIGYLYGQYLRIQNRFTGVLTGKGLTFGGSLVRKEATGYGTAYFMEHMLNHVGDTVNGKTCIVSGSGNVALYCIQKLNNLGAKVVACSDSTGFIYDKEGIREQKLDWLKTLKEQRRGSIREYADHFKCEFYPGKRLWSVPCELAFPCATQNELDESDAKTLLSNKLIGVAEGANMPCVREAVIEFQKAGVLYGPAKAANAGGVAVSGLEQSQNALRISWPFGEVDTRLQEIMHNIHHKCVKYGTLDESKNQVDYVKGANLAGFIKVADSMLAYGVT